MARGGARPGSGRKKGTVSEQSRAKKELAAKVAAEGVTPLEILTQTMRDLWDESSTGGKINIGKRMQACAIAEKVAPYVHPRLSAVSQDVNLTTVKATKEQRDAAVAAALAADADA